MNPEKFQIKPVTNAEETEMFLNVPIKVYQNDPNWVQPLRSSIAKQLSPENTFFQYGECQQFIAVSETSGEPLGRVVAAINKRLIERENQPIGLFGYFECVEDFEVAKGLLDKAAEWLQKRGIKTVRGPINLSTHNNCLLLVDGFDSQPFIMMPYNPSYYPEFVEKAGWQKAKDAYAYDFDASKPLDDKFERGYKVASKSGINFRQLRLKGEDFDKDCRSLYQLFTTAFTNNWSSTKRTEEEFLEEAKDLQQLVDPNIFWIAEYKGEMVGFFMALPDYNIALKHVNGKLNWCGIIKFLWYRRQINAARVIAICSLPEYRRKMVPLALIYLGMQGGTTNNKAYQKAELSWVWEDNMPSRKVIEATGATICKTYRIYEKQL
jgi:GNAT superfamily N-acetyltransferase